MNKACVCPSPDAMWCALIRWTAGDLARYDADDEDTYCQCSCHAETDAEDEARDA